MLQNLRFYCFICLIKNSVYYCHVPVRIGLHLSNSFIQHHHWISLRWVDWCVWLPSLHCFIYLFICDCFILVFFLSQCYNTYVCSHWKFHLILLLLYFLINFMTYMSNTSDILTILMPVTGFFLMGMIWCKTKNICCL